MHFSTKYIGKKWTPLGRGDDEFDCYGLVWYLYKHHNDVELPMYMSVDPTSKVGVTKAMNKALEQSTWKRIYQPEDFCLVAMSKKNAIHHVGVYFDVSSGRVVHSCDYSSVISSSMNDLRNLGFQIIRFYKYNG